MRIHKCLCYALNDVQVDEYDIIDPRFDPKVNDEDFREKLSDNSERDKFLLWAWENRDGLVKELLKRAKGISSDDSLRVMIDLCFHWALKDKFDPSSDESKRSKIEMLDAYRLHIHEPEFGFPNVYGFVGVTHKSWYRYDDNIDYYENSTGPEENRGSHVLVEVPCGFYPYSGMMFRKACPEIEEIPVPERLQTFIQKSRGREGISTSEYSMLIGKWANDQDPIAGQEAADYIRKCYRPEIPDEILLYAYYFGFFKDWARTVQDLKPYIYTYWC